MSVGSSENRPWPAAPDFTDSPRGYWGYEVDRLLSDLEAADAAGEPLGPIIDERNLSEVGFGYTMAEVDAHIATLRGRRTSSESATSPTPNLVKDQRLPSGPPAGIASPQDTSGPAVPVMGAPAPRTGTTAALLAEIDRPKSFPRPSGATAGYSAEQVDRFFSELGAAVHAGRDVVSTIEMVRFPMTRWGVAGYDVKEVDVALDRLASLASGGDNPHQPGAYAFDPYGQYDPRSVERNPYQGFSTPTTVKPTRSIVRTVIRAAVFIFIMYNFFRVLTGFGF